MSVIKSPEDLNSFAEDNIKIGSYILGHWWNGRNKLYAEGYIKYNRSALYQFPHVRKIKESWQNSTYDMVEYCARFNNGECKITFYELLKNVVELEPTPYKELILK